MHSATSLAPRIRYGSKGPLVTEVQETSIDEFARVHRAEFAGLAQAFKSASAVPGDPQTWTDAEERALLDDYIGLRAETSMTDSDKRAQVVLDAAARGVISAARGSFRA